MTFAHPHWLIGLLLLPFLLGLCIYLNRYYIKKFETFAQKALWNKLIPAYRPVAHYIKSILFCLGLGCLLFALAHPQYGIEQESVEVNGIDIFFVVDTSLSMDAQDIIPSRLSKTKHWIKNFIHACSSERFGMIAFAQSSYVMSPLTSDIGYIEQTIETLSTQLISVQGTNIGNALETTLLALNRGAEQPVRKNDVASHAVILISDGEDHDSAALKIADQFQTNNIQFYVLGVGTAKGGSIPVYQNGVQSGFKKDKKGNRVISKFNSDFLSKLAQKANGKYFDLSSTEAEIQTIVSELGITDHKKTSKKTIQKYKQWYQIPLAICIVLLFLENFISARKKRLIFLFFITWNAWTQEVEYKVYQENKKGIASLEKNNPEAALSHFLQAQALSPKTIELEFNQALALAQKKDFENAIQIFQHTLQDAHPLITALSHYNLGNLYALQNKKELAALEYAEAIEQSKTLQQPALEKAARKNLELLYKQPEPQKKPDSKENNAQSEQSKKPEQKPESEEKSDPQQKPEPEKKQEPESSKESSAEETSKASEKFSSQKLDPQSAKRIMSELKEKEKQLQERLQAKPAQSKSLEKDW